MHTPIDSEIEEALIERTAAYRQSGGHVIPFSTPEMQLVQQLWRTKQLARRLIRSTAAQFSVIRKSGRAHLQATDLGNEILQLLSSLVGPFSEQYPCHLFDPRIDLFMECASKRNLMPAWRPFLPAMEAQLLPLVDGLNGFAQDVRKRSNTNAFKAKVAAFQAETDKRHKDLQDYFNQLSILYPYAHVVRMDFSYRPDQFVGFSHGEEMHRKVCLHGEALLEHLTKSWGSAVAGYAWKRDFASARGYQYHLVVILNGPQPQELNNIVDSLGHQWREVITAGMGLFFHCHGGRRHDFKYRGLIAMNHYAKPMEEHLRLVPLFMTLTDGIVAFAPRSKAKPYGRGKLNKVAKTQASKMPEFQAPHDAGSTGSWPFSMSTGLI